jgi:ketosteroid isomerase-like protein
MLNMKGKNKAVAFAILSLATLSSVNSAAQKQDDAELLRVRETVWRAWFAGDTNALKELVPPETIVISGGEEQWKHQSDVLRSSAEFHAKGGKLIQLEFPRTEVQHFGNVAVVWSTYALEIEMNGKRSPDSGRVTEIFVWRDGHWMNPGWHTDAGK